jgi:predicted transcriptional regulator
VKTSVISVRLSPPLVSRLDQLCQAAVQTRSQVLRLLILRASTRDLPRAWRDMTEEERQLLAAIQ